MSDRGEITVTLGVREARALIAAANMMSVVWEPVLAGDPGLSDLVSDHHGVTPLNAAAMKLETALMVEGQAP